MNNTLAMQVSEYYPIICPAILKRKRTAECESNALNVLADYRHWGQITRKEHEELKREITLAPHDDAISDIMTKLRKRVYN